MNKKEIINKIEASVLSSTTVAGQEKTDANYLPVVIVEQNIL